jgi:mono/diheme cytochrome c family protein
MRSYQFAALLLLAAALPAPAAAAPVTYTRDVAPLLWKNCAGCHHPGEVGPFSLLTYKDAARRANFLRDVTAARRMPPWKAEPGFGPIHGVRRLSDAEITTLARWAEAGAPEGDPKDLPTPPTFPTGWQLGEPDLVLTMPEPWTVPAGGPDVYRCFVLPLPLDGDKTVAAAEFRAGNRKVVHHAGLFLDDKGQGRKKDRADGKPGYTSFGGPGIVPSGGLGGWTMGAMPHFLPDGTGMVVKQGSDLVLQMHYHPSGKEETDRSQVGLYFTKKPATRFATGLAARDTTLFVPAGARRHHAVARTDPLPADVEALSVSPHAHFLGREFKATATLPDGTTRPLVWIKDWDFHWHEVYHFDKPLKLPKGTVVQIDGWFDNTADNPKNPNSPPKDMKYGSQLTDEMLLVHVEVVTASRADLAAVEAMRGSRFGPGAVKKP